MGKAEHPFGGSQLGLGQSISSPNGQYKLVLQGDGNLVELDGSTTAWAAGTQSGRCSPAVMQGDGNFVVYNASNSPLWASNTSGNSGADLVLTDTGTLEVVLLGRHDPVDECAVPASRLA